MSKITPFPVIFRPLISVDESKLDRTRTAFIFTLPCVTHPVSIEKQVLDDDLSFHDDVRRDQR